MGDRMIIAGCGIRQWSSPVFLIEHLGKGQSMRKLWSPAAITASTLFCTSCSEVVVKSELVSQSNDLMGFVYSLPIGQILINALRTQISKIDLAKAQTAVSQANAAIAKDQAAITAANGDATKTAAAQAALSSDKAALDAANTSLALTTANQNKWQETATLTVLPIAPDPTARYVSDLIHDDTRDDTLNISVVNGLLTSTTLTSTDQTPNIIVTLADTVITLVAMAGGVPVPAASRTAPLLPPTDCEYSIAEVFDPLNKEQVDNINMSLKTVGARVEVGDSALVDPSQQPVPPNQGTSSKETNLPGLVYRVATPVALQISSDPTPNLPLPTKDTPVQCELASPITAQSITAVVPDTRSRYVVSSTAGPFTTTNLTFGFSSGLLTNYSVQRPSEVAAIAGIPLRIANDIMQIPTQLLQARFNFDTQATALVNAQGALKRAGWLCLDRFPRLMSGTSAGCRCGLAFSGWHAGRA